VLPRSDLPSHRSPITSITCSEQHGSELGSRPGPSKEMFVAGRPATVVSFGYMRGLSTIPAKYVATKRELRLRQYARTEQLLQYAHLD
jgi:hypothetical protein